MANLPRKLLEKVQDNAYIEDEVFDALTSAQIIALAPIAMRPMQEKGHVHIAGTSLWNAVTEYGLENLPSDFLRVLYKHYFSHTF